MDFFNSWPLFFRPYMLTLIAGAVLAIMGVVATARRQLFMAVAVAQTSLMGYAFIAFIMGTQASGVLSAGARDAVVIVFAIIAAIITMLGNRENQGAQGGRLDGDERTAWVFVTTGALAVFISCSCTSGYGANSAATNFFGHRCHMDGSVPFYSVVGSNSYCNATANAAISFTTI